MGEVGLGDAEAQLASARFLTRFDADLPAGKRIDLTAKEYSLLEYLMSNAGRVLSRTMIIEHVWDQSFDGVTNIVDVYVRHLRNKVDDACQQKLIRTIRGVGYSIGHGAQP